MLKWQSSLISQKLLYSGILSLVTPDSYKNYSGLYRSPLISTFYFTKFLMKQIVRPSDLVFWKTSNVPTRAV